MRATAVLLLYAVVLGVAIFIGAHDWTPDPAPDPAPVVRSQGGGSSRPTSTTQPGWRLPNGSCVHTGTAEAAQIGARRDKGCGR